jgi:hypothetical protein
VNQDDLIRTAHRRIIRPKTLSRTRTEEPAPIEEPAPFEEPIHINQPAPIEEPTYFGEPTYPHETTEINIMEDERERVISPPIRRRRIFSPLRVESSPAKVVVSPTGFIKQDPAPEVVVAAQTPPGVPAESNPQAARPNYAAMSPEERDRYRSEFNVKLGILRRSFQNYGFSDFNPNASLDAIHDVYAGYVKQVVVSLNCSQYKTYLVIMFLALEAFGTKVLRLDMTGYTRSQLQMMNRYDSILIELGEKYYVSGGSSWPVEMRLLFMGLTSAVTFIVVKYLSNYLGGNAMMGPIQLAIDQIMSGATASVNSLPEGIPPPPSAADPSFRTAPSASVANPPPPAATNTGGPDIMSLVSGLMGGGAAGGAGGIADIIAKFGSALISKPAAPSAGSTAKAGPAPPPARAPRRQPKFKAPST